LTRRDFLFGRSGKGSREFPSGSSYMPVFVRRKAPPLQMF
jgi:hypothetical protein